MKLTPEHLDMLSSLTALSNLKLDCVQFQVSAQLYYSATLRLCYASTVVCTALRMEQPARRVRTDSVAATFFADSNLVVRGSRQSAVQAHPAFTAAGWGGLQSISLRSCNVCTPTVEVICKQLTQLTTLELGFCGSAVTDRCSLHFA